MPATFLLRFVVAVIGGALLGLLVGVVGRSAFGADWNVFLVMAAGIVVGAVGLALAHGVLTEQAAADEHRGVDRG